MERSRQENEPKLKSRNIVAAQDPIFAEVPKMTQSGSHFYCLAVSARFAPIAHSSKNACYKFSKFLLSQKNTFGPIQFFDTVNKKASQAYSLPRICGYEGLCPTVTLCENSCVELKYLTMKYFHSWGNV